VLSQIAEAHRATSRQVALAFLLRRPSLFAIPKAATIEHVDDNAAAARVHLTEGDLARIDEAFPMVPRDELPTA
jgi:diketogulonate reductase-like aldo/keto reductase